jgi:hypothetical protein
MRLRTWSVEPGALGQTVVAVGVGHVVEALPEFDQTVDQRFGDLDVGVGFAAAVHDEEPALEALRVVDRRGAAVPFGVARGRAHEDLLEPRVVELRSRLRRHRDRDVVVVRLSEDRIERVRAAAAPAPDAHPGEIDVRTLPAEFTQALGLLVGGEGAEAAEHRSPPRGALRSGRAAIVD